MPFNRMNPPYSEGEVREYPTEQNLFALFHAQADATPDSVAVISGTGSVTFRELHSLAADIGNHLRPRIISEQPVGLLAKRSTKMIAAMLGILKAGGAYVPLDPDDPPERNRRVLDVSGCELVVGHSDVMHGYSRLAGQSGRESSGRSIEFVDIDELTTRGAAAPVTLALPDSISPGGQRLAYILFTSGSSGEPKGVEVEHRSVINLLCSARDLIEFGETDRFLAASTIGFDISVAEIFLPLITGGSLLLRSREILMNPHQLVEDITRFDVTVMQTGPTVWSLLASNSVQFPKLRVAISTGEAITNNVARKLFGFGQQVWNLYGPTETTVWSAAARLELTDCESEERLFNSASIGRPIANTRIYIVGGDGSIAAAGVRGELCIGGLGVARGYRRNEVQSNERFVFLGTPGERVYRTGDVAEWGMDGRLLYFGRSDDQLSIRGVRIEPGEVEAAIRTQADVREVAITWYPGVSGDRAIVAAIITHSGRPMDTTRLRERLAEQLPPQMIPSQFQFYEDLPRTQSEKVDYGRIREDAIRGRVAARSEPRRPFNPTEDRLLRIWRRLLRVKSIRPGDHFLTVGGDSLAVVAMLADIEREFRVTLPIQNVLQSLVLEKLAAQIDVALKEPHRTSASPFIFPLNDLVGRPVFFFDIDLNMGALGRWKVASPLYGVSYWAQRIGRPKAESIVELCRGHVLGIRAIQPEGSYRLAGFSFGCLLALETAQQLRKQGQDVEILFLLHPEKLWQVDAESAETGVGTLKDAPRSKSTLTGILNVCLRIADPIVHGPLTQWLAYHVAHLRGTTGQRSNSSVRSSLFMPKSQWPAIWYAKKRLAKGYRARPYAGRSVAFFSEDEDRRDEWITTLGPDTTLYTIQSSVATAFVEESASEWMCVLQESLHGPTSVSPEHPPRSRKRVAVHSLRTEDVASATDEVCGDLPKLESCCGRARETGRNLFVLPSISGETLFARPVVEHLPPDVSVLGLHPTPDDVAGVFLDFESIASSYVEAIREHQPHGPYLLFGYSYGGLLAYEIAQQLVAAGDVVDLLAIVDTGPRIDASRGRARRFATWLAAFIANLPRWLNIELRRASLRNLLSRTRQKLRFWGRWLRSPWRTPTRELEDVFETNHLLERNRDLLRRRFDAFQRYQVKPTHVPLTLFRARVRPLYHSLTPDLGWGPFAHGGMEIVDLAGDHVLIFKTPQAAELASALGERLPLGQDTQRNLDGQVPPQLP